MHKIMDYLNEYQTLTPSDAAVGSVTTSDWWTPLKDQLDDLFWLYFANRTIFINRKFIPHDTQTTYNNILRTIAILLKSKKPQLDRMYEAVTADYNPLWNVDGVTGRIWTDEHTGTNTQSKTGTDTLQQSGSNVDTLSGRDVDTLSGSDRYAESGYDNTTSSGSDQFEEHTTKDDTTRTGSFAVAGSGRDTNTHDKFTFDDQSEAKKEAVDSTQYGKTETTTYNSLKDAHVYDNENETTYGRTDERETTKTSSTTYGKTDTMAYGKTDTMTFGKQDQTTYNNQIQDVRNLADEHIEMEIRQGNIGLTKSTDLVESEWDLRSKFDFFYYVAHLCVNQFTYGIEEV